MRRWLSVGLLLDHGLQCWPKSKPTLGQRLMFSRLGAGHLLPGGGGVWFISKKINCSQNWETKIVYSIECGKKIICSFCSFTCKKK